MHIHGSAALLEMRGEKQLRNELGLRLFMQTRNQIVSILGYWRI